jgi:CheY-like chemotaxis protein
LKRIVRFLELILAARVSTLALEDVGATRAYDAGANPYGRDVGGRDASCPEGSVVMAVILVVEDEVFTRQIAEMMIQDWGHDTLSASDAAEALSFLRSDQHIDALFTDIYLKDSVLGGFELAHQAVELRPHLRVLYTTGNFVTEKMKALFVEGTKCLCKPYTQDQLQDSVEALLAA